MSYDVFISYRRAGGYETAKHIYDLLRRDGYRVSFDLDTLRNGDFDTQLLDRIDECTDFILILNKEALDRCLDPTVDRKNDWMRIELARALESNKNIIPIMLPGFNDYPDNLPDDIKEVRRKNGPKHSMEYFDEFYKKLKNHFMQSKAVEDNGVPHLQQPQNFSSNTATLQIYPDRDCQIKKYGEVLGVAKKNGYFPINLKKGRHRLEFVALDDESKVVYEEYTVTDPDMEDVLDVKFDKTESKINNEEKGKETEQQLFNSDAKMLHMKALNASGKEKYELLLQAAEAGSTDAMVDLGDCYNDGEGVEKDNATAFNWYIKAAENGNPKGNAAMGIAYYKTDFLDLEQDLDKAEKYLLKAAESDLTIAQGILSIVYYEKELYDKSKYWALIGSQLNDTNSLLTLGLIYRNGNGVEIDEKKAFDYLKKAADGGNQIGQYLVGTIYEEGDGVPQDYDKARMYYTMAAEQNDEDALYKLGNLYVHGHGTDSDVEKAIQLFEKASEYGNIDALNVLGIIYSNQNYGHVDLDKSFDYFAKAAHAGHPWGMYNYGDFLIHAYGCKQDIPEGLEWLEKSAEAEIADAYALIGDVYAQEEFGGQDFFKAFRNYKKAAQGGSIQGMKELGFCFLDGKGCSANLEDAIHWLEKAHEEGDAIATTVLGNIYSNVENENVYDIDKAFQYYLDADRENVPFAKFRLGRLVMDGEGCEADIDQGMALVREAADAGCEDAQNWLVGSDNLEEDLDYNQIENLIATFPSGTDYRELSNLVNNYNEKCYKFQEHEPLILDMERGYLAGSFQEYDDPNAGIGKSFKIGWRNGVMGEDFKSICKLAKNLSN